MVNDSSNFGTVGKYLLTSVIAGGLGYAYSTSTRSSQPQSQSQEPEGPKYGSPQDFINVGGGL